MPHLVWCLIDDVPTDEIVCQSGEVFLLALPFAVSSDFDARADDREWGVSTLNVASRHDFVLSEGVGDEVLLELRFDVLARLVGVAAIYTIFTRAALEERASEADSAEWRDDAPSPEDEATSGATDAMQKVLVERINHHDTGDLLHVPGAEDARNNATGTGRNQNPRSFLTSFGKGLGESIGRHSSRVGRWSIVGEGIARAVPVAVTRDGAILIGSIRPVLKIILEWLLASLE